MKFLRFISVAIFCLGLFSISPAQAAQDAPDEKKNTGWTRIQSPDGEFSIELPSNYIYFYDKAGFTLSPANKKPYNFTEMHLLNASLNKTVMRIEIYTVSKPKSYLEAIQDNDRMDGDDSKEDLPGFIVRQTDQTSIRNLRDNSAIEVAHIAKYIASADHVYVISAANRGKASYELKHFLSSIRLNKDKPVKNIGENTAEKIVSLSDLKPVTIDEVAFEGKDLLAPITDKPADIKTDDKTPAENKAPVLVLTKPQPTFTESFRRSGQNFSDILRMRVMLSANGGITKVWLLSLLPGGLSRNSFFAAMRLRFIPAEKDGLPVDVNKIIEYHFSLY